VEAPTTKMTVAAIIRMILPCRLKRVVIIDLPAENQASTLWGKKQHTVRYSEVYPHLSNYLTHSKGIR
jgi:hypothetical protein